MAEVVLNGISKAFAKDTAVDDVSLTIEDGSFVVLLGPTGAGKTTTLRLIAGLEQADAGSISIGGIDVTHHTPAQRNVAMVFQQYSLYPHLSVRDNLAFPLKSPILKTPKAEIEKKVNNIAEVLHISHKLDNKATELSGGEMQRVSIGRALVRNPAIYLMDEPLSSLDAKLRSDLRLELKRLQSELGSTILYVTHDQVEAMTLATQVGVLNEGKLVQFGSPREIYENPASLYVATRLGLPRINTLPSDTFTTAPKGAASIGMRPEHIALDASGKNGAPCQVSRVEHLGDQTRLHLTLQSQIDRGSTPSVANSDQHNNQRIATGAGQVVTLVDAHTSIRVGDTVAITPDNPLYFDQRGFRVPAGDNP